MFRTPISPSVPAGPGPSLCLFFSRSDIAVLTPPRNPLGRLAPSAWFGAPRGGRGLSEASSLCAGPSNDGPLLSKADELNFVAISSAIFFPLAAMNARSVCRWRGVAGWPLVERRAGERLGAAISPAGHQSPPAAARAAAPHPLKVPCGFIVSGRDMDVSSTRPAFVGAAIATPLFFYSQRT